MRITNIPILLLLLQIFAHYFMYIHTRISRGPG